MKKLSANLLLIVLLLLSATGVVAQTTITVNPADGSYNKTGWCANWTSSSNNNYPVTKIDVEGGINNMNQATKSGGFEFAVGSNGNSDYTWNFSVPGYLIESYSFKFKSKENDKNVNVVVGDQTITSSYSEEKLLSVTEVNAQVASFQLKGSNYAIIVTELTFTVRPFFEAGKVYRFVNARADRSLAADGTNDVHVKETDLNDKKQEWYVTKDGDYYVLRNVACGKYLKGNGRSADWSMSDDYSHDYNKFTLHVSNKTFNTLHTNTLADYAYMHDDNNGDDDGYNVVGWLNGNSDTGSHWTINEVSYTAEELQALFDNFIPEENIVPALSAIFSDDACTVLNTNYAEMPADELLADENYNALPSTLKKMVQKVRGGEWSEDNANADKAANGLNWNSEYAKKFRVQMYEPFSIAGDITSWLGMNSHANNDNPTGIYVHAPGNIYVMVEGEIKEGATLRLIDAGSNNRIGDKQALEQGVVLEQGLNVIPFTAAGGHLYVCYNVDTYNPDGTTSAERFPHKISDYEPLKIHIEGGSINGFYNACGDFRAENDSENLWKEITGSSVDNDEDWVYMEERANLSVLPILGHREILLLQLDDEQEGRGLRSLLPEAINCPETPYSNAGSWDNYGMGCNPSTGKINIVMEAWDRIMYSQLATMGLLSKADMARMNEFYPRWNADGTVAAEIYDYENASAIDGKTLEQFCDGVDYSEYFNHHGTILGTSSGNPYGSGDHVGYPIDGFGDAIYNLPNTAGSTWGPAHEIGHQHQAIFNLSGLTEVTNNLFSNISLWYKGMSTSRYNGSDGSLERVLAAFNTKGSDVYTNNIWALTHLYYRLWLYYHLTGNNTQFYPRLFELLRHDRMQGGSRVSGDTTTLHFYKLVCQAAGEDLTEFFRAHGYFSVMDERYVGDYSSATYNVSQEMIDEAIAEIKAKNYPQNLAILFINDDDETANYLQHNGTTERVIYGETTPNSDFGSVSDFISGNIDIESSYTATCSDGVVTMSGGEGGVGFLVLNEKNEIVAFSNKRTFNLGDEAKHALVSGKARIVAVNGNSEMEEVAVDLVAVKREVLVAMINDAQAVVDKVDATYTKVGYYKPVAVTALVSAIEAANAVLEEGAGYEGAYEMLYSECNKVTENADAKIGLVSGAKYAIKSNVAGDYMTINTETNAVKTTNNRTQPSTDDALWIFETTGAICKIKHAGSGKYLQQVSNANGVDFTVGDNAVDYCITEADFGIYAISTVNFPGRYMDRHSADKVATWDKISNNAKWTITMVDDAAREELETLADLQSLMTKTKALIDEVATISYTKGEAIDLQTTQPSGNYYLSCNAPSSAEGSIDNLVDGATSNHFHTDYTSEPLSGSHYMVVDFGEAEKLEHFLFSYTTRSSATDDFPSGIDVYGSNDGNKYKFIGSVKNLPQTAGEYWEAISAMTTLPCRYLRFNVHARRGYWHMAEFDIYPVTSFNVALRGFYQENGITVPTVEAAYEEYLSACLFIAGESLSEDRINAKKDELQQVYDALQDELNAIINTRKVTLATLAGETSDLINVVGSVELPNATVNEAYAEYVSEEMLLSTYFVKEASLIMANASNEFLSVEMLDAQIVDIINAKTALYNACVQGLVPVRITTDVNNPILYKIRINRGNGKYLQYDEESRMVAVAGEAIERAQTWYFMQGDDAGSVDDIFILPYKGEGKMLATNDFNDGNSKVKAVEKGTEGYSYNWNIRAIENSEWLNITITNGNGKTCYFSNHGGESKKMGFYNSSSDGGSQFQFVIDPTDYTVPDAYYDLVNKYTECGGEKVHGVGIGQYKEASVIAYNAAYNAATALIGNTALEESEYVIALEALTAAFNALEYNKPAADKFYRIRSAYTGGGGYSEDALVYVNETNVMQFAKGYDAHSSRAIWQFVPLSNGGYNLKSMHTCDFAPAQANYTYATLTGNAREYTIDVLNNETGELKLISSMQMHAQSSGNAIVGYNTSNAGSASSWFIEELTADEVAAIYYPYTISALGYGTLMLGFDAVIPEGITAYYAKSAENDYVQMEEIEDVIPANTAVILKSNEALETARNLEFVYSTGEATAIEGNMLRGTLYKGVVKCDSENVNNNVYIMTATTTGDAVQFSLTYENLNADGTKDPENDGQNNNGGHILNAANRAYLVIAKGESLQASALNLRFGNDGTTAVEEVVVENNNDVIYDLQGRRVSEITEAGIYIVNGGKVLVK